jgi:quercetin dioxygenase-like cupin family protein
MGAGDAVSDADYPNPPHLRSRYVDPDDLEWQASDFEGIETKVLWSDPDTGRSTILFKLAPGAVVPPHEHVDVEQTWVISGTFEDHEGVALPGHYIWRPAGSRHSARSVDGALILSMFAAPNRFDAGTRFYTELDDIETSLRGPAAAGDGTTMSHARQAPARDRRLGS